MKAVVTGLVLFAFAPAGCSTPSSNPSEEDLALDNATNACFLLSRADDTESFGGDEVAFENLQFWETYEAGVIEARSAANRAEALDSRWASLARTIGDFSLTLVSLTSTWNAEGPTRNFSDVFEGRQDDPVLRGLGDDFVRIDAECARVDDVLALTQELNETSPSEDSRDNGSTSREAEAILTAVAGIVSIALFLAVLWFVWWMAGRKNRNQTLYIILAIFFPLIMIIAVLVQKKLPEPESAAEQDASATDPGPSPSDSQSGDDS